MCDPKRVITLRPITIGTVRAVCSLTVSDDQHKFVAPNAVSLAEALFVPEAWYRAIYSGEDLAGFVSSLDKTTPDEFYFATLPAIKQAA